jgi:hypothetical protein
MTVSPAIASLDTRFPRLDTCSPSVGRNQGHAATDDNHADSLAPAEKLRRPAVRQRLRHGRVPSYPQQTSAEVERERPVVGRQQVA